MKIVHIYSKNTFWLQLSFTWNSNNGQIDVYLNGQLKSSCSNIAVRKEIPTAGVFILGQTHTDNYFSNLNKKNVLQSADPVRLEPVKNNEFSLDKSFNQYSMENILLQADEIESYFVKSLAFVGRVFGFNIWNHVKSATFIQNIYNDCKLAYCGNASQWSDFRQGTKGDVKMKWPTDLLWKRNTCFNETFQQMSCNKFCNKEIGPICRETIDQNILWPMSKANQTMRIKCLENFEKYSTRHCKKYVENEYNSEFNGLQAIASWSSPNINDCIQDNFRLLKEDVRVYYTMDNFDESKIFSFLEKLYDFTIQLIKLDTQKSRSIFDISTIIDTLFYLIDAQVFHFDFYFN